MPVPPFPIRTNGTARLGQCFSTTRPIVDVDAIEIPDIEYNGYCFSDGVQDIISHLSDLVAGRKNLPRSGGADHQCDRI